MAEGIDFSPYLTACDVHGDFLDGGYWKDSNYFVFEARVS